MRVINKLPDYYIEHEFFNQMLNNFDSKLFSDKIVYITHDRNKIDVTGNNVIVIQTAGNELAQTPTYANKVKLVFKHHLDRDNVGNTYHIPLPYVKGFSGNSNTDINKRNYDVMFVGRKLRTRVPAVQAMDEFKASPGNRNIMVEYTSAFMSGLPLDKYSEVLSNTKIAISPCGAKRCECLRFSEAVRCGCAIIAEKHPPLRVFKACPAFYMEDWSALRKVIDSLTPDRLSEIYEKTKACYQKYFSPEGVANYINSIVSKHK